MWKSAGRQHTALRGPERQKARGRGGQGFVNPIQEFGSYSSLAGKQEDI
jgi:hypothetical protein